MMKLGFLQVITFFLLITNSRAQTVAHVYRFDNNLEVAQPTCGPDLVAVNAPGSCAVAGNAGNFTEDVLSCGLQRKVYHNNLHGGLMYANNEGTITDTYTIQMYVKNISWGKIRTRIIDFSNGQSDQGIYFKDLAGSPDRCLDFYPVGGAGRCPFFNANTYYLLTFTRNGQSGKMDVYVNNTLFVTYNDVDKRYVGKTGTPVYVYRDDGQVTCESGEANFAYLSFANYFSDQAAVSKTYQDICAVSSINVTADFLINPNPSCGNGNIKVAYTGVLPAGAGYTFEWDFDGATILSGTGRGPYALRWTTTGTKSVSLRIINETCGNAIINIKKTMVTFPDVSVSVKQDECQIGADLVINASNGTSPFQYSLDSVTFQASGTFKVALGSFRIFVKDANGCIKETSVDVPSTGAIQLKTLADTIICLGQKVQLLTTGTVTDYRWAPADGLDSPSAKDPFASPIQSTEYIVKAVKGNCSRQDTVLVTVIPAIEVSVSPDALIPYDKPYQLFASSAQLNGISGVKYSWLPAIGLDDPAVANPRATLKSSQAYTVELSTPQGCKGQGKVNLTVIPPAWIVLPDVFTPNGDGKNEILLPVAKGISSLKYLNVYNRWGEVVYFGSQLSEGWDGRIKGIEAASGTYVWKLEAVTEGGEMITGNGTVLLIR